jgi:glycosyltransferase involved in cell wall biosynthesis
MIKSKICYIDCTETFNSGLNTGIQRVVKNIIVRLNDLEGYCGFSYVPVIAVGSELFALNNSIQDGYFATRFANKILGSLRNILDSFFAAINITIKDGDDAVLNNLSSKRNFHKLLAKLYDEIISCCRGVIPLCLQIPLLFDTFCSGSKKVEIQSEDIFFLADAFWNINSLKAAKMAKNKKAKVIFLIYDMIPIAYPDFFNRADSSNFLNYFPKYLDMVDGLIAISRFTMNEIAEHCKAIGFRNDLPMDYFYLGADFCTLSLSSYVEISDTQSFLMVGTIEPRKNHVFIINAFERMWETGAQVRLNIVGRVGWKSDHILEKIKGSHFFNKNMFFYESLSDTDLSVIMQQATALILASTVEGFGLPLIEAMHMNITVLASDIPVFREIGGDYPIYFSLDDTEALIEKVNLVAEGKYVKEKSENAWISWDESVRILLDKVVNMAGKSQGS